MPPTTLMGFPGFGRRLFTFAIRRLCVRLPLLMLRTRHVIDLFAEHRCLTNGMPFKRERKKTASESGKAHKRNGRDSLLNALAIRGLGIRNLILTVEEPTPEQWS
jgi:hypothetical protein